MCIFEILTTILIECFRQYHPKHYAQHLINSRRHRPFCILSRHKGGGGWYDPLAVSPLIELELREKNEHVARREAKRLIYKLKVLGQPVTSEVRSSAEK